MSKTFKIAVLILVLLTVASVIWFRRLQHETRKHSPKETVVESMSGIEVKYCSPGVKGRAIFGGLVPYGEVWRTGANEPTSFESPIDLVFGSDTLKAGFYTLWTIPNEDSWQVIWNSGYYPWGVSWGGTASRKPEKDVLQLQVIPEKLTELQERFEIGFDEEPTQFWLKWEFTKVNMPYTSVVGNE
ncbi:MAG: DUF2911 domain-containing protein [Bacteroidia bacterium]|jgi:hypothetical protein